MAIKILNLIIVLFVPFLMLGVIKKTKAFWGGRYGASVFQPLYDFVKLMKKDFVISKTTSGVFRITPVVVIASALFAALFVPLASSSAIINIPAGFYPFCLHTGVFKIFLPYRRNGYRKQL